jgi:hypothetical protein
MKNRLIWSLFISMILALYSCSIERHHYTGGFHFENRLAKKKTLGNLNQTENQRKEMVMNPGSEKNPEPQEREAILTASIHKDFALLPRREEPVNSTQQLYSPAEEKMQADTSYFRQKSKDDLIKSDLKKAKLSLNIGSLFAALGTLSAICIIGLYLMGISFVYLIYIFLILLYLTLLFLTYYLYLSDKIKNLMAKEIGKDELWNEWERLEKKSKKYFKFFAVMALAVIFIGRFLLYVV